MVVLIIGIGGGIMGRAKTGEFFEEFKKITVEGSKKFILFNSPLRTASQTYHLIKQTGVHQSRKLNNE